MGNQTFVAFVPAHLDKESMVLEPLFKRSPGRHIANDSALDLLSRIKTPNSSLCLCKMPRSIRAVINEISVEIPTWYDSEKRASLERVFKRLREDARYVAPELSFSLWTDLCQACDDYLPSPADPDSPWAGRVAAILSGSTDVKSPPCRLDRITPGSTQPDESASGGTPLESRKSGSS